MREWFLLTAVSLKNVYGISAMLYDSKKNKKSFRKIILFIAVVLCMIPAYSLYIYFASILYDSYAMLNQIRAYVAQFMTLGAIIILIFGISYILSYFYMSKDLDALLCLPVNPRNIILSKLLTITISEYLFIFPIMLPPIIKYGIAQNCSAIYYLEAVIAVALLPLTVLAIIAIIIIALMQGASLKIKKDKIQMITLFLTLALIMVFQFVNIKFSASMQYENQAELIADYLKNSNALLNNLTKIFFPAVLASKALINYNYISTLYYLIAYIFICGAVLYLCSVAGRNFYINSILKSSFANKSKSSLRALNLKTNSPMTAVFKNDLRLILRTPIYMFNCIGVIIVIPALILISSFASDLGDKINFAMLDNYKELSVLILAAAYTLFIGLTPILSTTFSREGQCFWITKTVPVTHNDQINARLLTHIVLSVVLLIASSISIAVITKLSVSAIAAAFVMGLIASMPTAHISLLIDTKRPLLVWDNPQRAVKQNMNVVISMLICLLYIILMGVVGFFSVKIFNENIAVIIVFAVAVFITFIFDKITRSKFIKLFSEIEI